MATLALGTRTTRSVSQIPISRVRWRARRGPAHKGNPLSPPSARTTYPAAPVANTLSTYDHSFVRDFPPAPRAGPTRLRRARRNHADAPPRDGGSIVVAEQVIDRVLLAAALLHQP
eukprot:6396789-Prymnesium_polylepis.1